MFLFPLAIIAGIIFLVYWILKGNANPQEVKQGNEGKSLDILKQRYAKGEISKSDFESIKNDIS